MVASVAHVAHVAEGMTTKCRLSKQATSVRDVSKLPLDRLDLSITKLVLLMTVLWKN